MGTSVTPISARQPTEDGAGALSDLGLEFVVARLKRLLDGDLLSVDELEEVVDAVEARVAASEPPPLSGLELMLSEACNLRCSYCFHGGMDGDLMPAAVIDAAVSLLVEGAEPGGSVSVTLFGGEPLLNPRGLEHVLTVGAARLRQQGLRPHFSITTNATTVTADIARLLAEHSVSIMVSLDGTPQSHDRHRRMAHGGSSYSATCRGIGELHAAGIADLTVRVTVAPDATPDLDANVRHVAGLEPARILVRPVDGVDWPEECWRTFRETVLSLAEAELRPGTSLELIGDYRELRGWGCGAGSGTLCIAAGGAVHACSVFLSSPRLSEHLVLGNVLTERPGDILRGFARREVIALIRQPGPRCESCPEAGHCSGGCPAHNFRSTGGFVERLTATRCDMELRRDLAETKGRESAAGAGERREGRGRWPTAEAC